LELNREVEDPDDRVPLMEVALGELPENQRTALVLKFYRGKSFREIGELLGISENTAGSRVRYGMEKMRKMMEALK
jgi:RNA polymerase sigma-70 factor (ECF subfamily)